MAETFHEFDDFVDAVADVDHDRPPALVVGNGTTALGVARAIAKNAAPVLQAAPSPGIVWRSDDVPVAGRITDPREDPAGFRDDLAVVADAAGPPPLVVPCSPAGVHALLEDVPAGVDTLYDDPDAALALLDTERAFAAAADADVPAAGAYHVAGTGSDDGPLETASPDAIGDDLGFPLVCTPALAHEGLPDGDGAVRVDSAGDLEALADAAAADDVRLVAREHVAGVERSVGSYHVHGETHATVDVAVTARRDGPAGNECIVDLDHPDPTEPGPATEDALDLLHEAGVTGPCELRFAERDGAFVLTDVRPRPWRWVWLPASMDTNQLYVGYVRNEPGEESYAPDPPRECRWVAMADYWRHLAAGGADVLAEDDWFAVLSGRSPYAMALATAVHRDSDLGPTYSLIRRELGVLDG
jgi:hypothetical protein